MMTAAAVNGCTFDSLHSMSSMQTQHLNLNMGSSPEGRDVCVLQNMVLPTVADQQRAYAIRKGVQQAHVMHGKQGSHGDLTLRTK